MGVFKRGNKLWVRYQDADGTWRNASTGYTAGQERLAEAVFDELASRVRAATAAGEAIAGPLTVRKYAADWLEERKRLDLDWKNDDARLRHHVLPVIGDMKIADVRTRHILEVFHRIRTNKERPVAPRTVYSIYSTVTALFRDAKLADKIEQTPCCLDTRHLGDLVDKDPEWRDSAIYSRDEAETLISDPRIPFDRQICYGLELLSGVRTGETAALRWRHHDPTKQPLGELRVAHAYSTLKGREKSTKTKSIKYVPVHPTLAAMLAEWKLWGWAAMMGRPPEPDDLIVPMPPEHAARRRTRTGEAFRGHDYAGERWRRQDLPALGWRHRRHYDMRATFITLAIEDGADARLLEERVTHAKKQRSAFDGYNRGRHWERTCAEVAKLRISRRPPGQGEVLLPGAMVGAQGTEPTETDASRYSARYSPHNTEESHAKILAHSPRAGERGPPRRAKPEARGPPSGLARSAQAAGSPVVRAHRSPRPRPGRLLRSRERPGALRGGAGPKRPPSKAAARPSRVRPASAFAFHAPRNGSASALLCCSVP
jgi:hypothetical protein